jgi:peptidoglycan/xylan/chitin deacetylase (PgdA/CDA1 family)
MELRRKIRLASLEVLHASKLCPVAPRFLTGVGAILTFHHVRPRRADRFQPNRHLEITPEFLDVVLTGIHASGDEIVSLDEARRRLSEGDFSRRFFVLTFDDGYRDARDFAYPVLKRHAAPFTTFVTSSFADGTGDLWWIALERAVAASARIDVTIAARRYRFAPTSDAARQKAFDKLYWALRALPDEGEMRSIIHRLAQAANVCVESICREFCMDWQEIAELAADPMATVGSHSESHLILAKVAAERARADIAAGVARMEAALGIRPQHFCYPVGDRSSAVRRDFDIAEELGFRTALTTRRGALYPEHRDHLRALPRLSINGNFQRLRYTAALLSGVPTAIANRFARLDVR